MRDQNLRETVVATRNKKKLEEIKQIMKGLNLKILSLEDFPSAPYVKEDGKTFLENAVKKALRIARFTRRLTLGEDSGLCIDALGGVPGIYSSRFSGREKNDVKNNRKVLESLEGIPLKRRSAHYVCAVALADNDGVVGVTGGKCNGLIGFELKGAQGFGYDPLFLVPKYKKTFAQMGPAVKHKMSHRYKALKKAKSIIERYYKNRDTSHFSRKIARRKMGCVPIKDRLIGH